MRRREDVLETESDGTSVSMCVMENCIGVGVHSTQQGGGGVKEQEREEEGKKFTRLCVQKRLTG